MPKMILSTAISPERAVLVGVTAKQPEEGWSIESSMDELNNLAQTAGARVVGRIYQRMDKPSSTYYLGSGKLRELLELKETIRYDLALFNDELLPRQQRNLEDTLNVKVIDRTALILDIFAKSAHTSEGKLQVELAQHRYLLPRLAGQWSHLERLGGGIGTRGPGESQIETDRRMIRKRISSLSQQIESVRRHRDLYRRKRQLSHVPLVALVGYTNAGKSTLLNALCNASVVTENKLFSTLDPTTRKLRLPDGRTILLTDTVGFIHKLPPLIVAAFRATLEELNEADLLVHVVDITSKDALNQSRTVDELLIELGLDGKPRLTVINKMDIVAENIDEVEKLMQQLSATPEVTLAVSAVKKWKLQELMRKIADMLDDQR